MNYLIFGKGANTGDLGIAAAMLQDIQAHDPEASIVYFSDRPTAFANLPELQGHTVELFRDISSSQHRRPFASLVFRAKSRLLGELGSRTARGLLLSVVRRIEDVELAMRLFALRFRPSILFKYEPELRRIDHYHAWADVVVRQGGPGWNDWVLKRKILRIRLAYLALARHHNVPMMMYAQSFGPFKWSTSLNGQLKRRLTRGMLNRMHLLTLRDTYSREALLRLGVTGPQIVEAADVAWNLVPAPATEVSRKLGKPIFGGDDRPCIGLTLRSFHGNYGITEAREQELVAEFAVMCDAIVEDMGKLIFLSTDYRDHGRRNDLDFLRLVQRRMKNPSGMHVVDQELMSRELKTAYGEMDLLISVRLHPGIFAMASGTPTLMIGYDPKCADAAEQMRVKDWYIDIHSFSAADALGRVRSMLAQQSEIESAIEEQARVVKQRARRSIQALIDLFDTI